MSHGFRTAVVAEACGDRHPAPHAANPFDMNADSADVVGEAEAIAFLESRAARRPVGTPRTMSACRVKCDLAACLDVVSDNSVSIEADPIGTIRRVCPRTSS